MLTVVTGATGQVGRRFVPHLLQWRATGDEVRVLVRDEVRGMHFTELGAQLAVGDLRDARDVRKALDGADAVVNLAAAFRGVPDDEAWAVNRDAAVDLGKAALEAGVSRFVQVSTNLVYGQGRDRPHVEDDESIPGGPMWGAYAASKAEAERGLVELHRRHGLGVAIGLLAFVYGDGDPHIAQWLPRAGPWAGNQRLHMVHHADVCQGLRRLLFAPGVAGRRYNIADNAPATAVELHQVSGVPVPDGMGGRHDDNPWWGIMSTERIRRELGFRPLYPSVWTARDAGAL